MNDAYARRGPAPTLRSVRIPARGWAATVALGLCAGSPVALHAAGLEIHGGTVGPQTNTTVLDYILIDGGAVVQGDVTNAATGRVTGLPVTAGELGGVAVGIADSRIEGSLVNRGHIDAASFFNTTAVQVVNATLGGGIHNVGFIGAGQFGTGLSLIDVTSVGGLVNTGVIQTGVTSFPVGDDPPVATFSSSVIIISGPEDGAIRVGGANFTGGIHNAGTVASGATAIRLGDENPFFPTAPVGVYTGGITNSGTITSASASGIATYARDFSGGITNTGTLQAQHSGVAMTVTDASGGIANGGSILSTAGLGVHVNVLGGAFTDGIHNAGIIRAAQEGVFATGTEVHGGITNTGSIASTDGNGINVSPAAFAGGVHNTGAITGGSGGVQVSAGQFDGGIVNTGTIRGTAQAAVWVGGGTFAGGVVNSGTLTSATSDGIDVFASAFPGAVVNSGVIDAAGVGIKVGWEFQGTQVQGGITNTGTLRGGLAAIDTTLASGPTVLNLQGGTVQGDIRLSPTYGDTVNATGGTLQGDIVATGPRDDRVKLTLNGADFTLDGDVDGIDVVHVDPGTLFLNGNVQNTNTLRVDADTVLVLGPRANVMPVTFLLDPAATVAFAPAPDGSRGRLSPGAATLGGTLSVPRVPGPYPDRQTYTNLLGWTTRTGTFSQVDTGSIFLRGVPSYGATQLDLRVDRVPFDGALAGLDGNPGAVATALERAYVFPTPSADAAALYSLIFDFSAEDYVRYLDAASGSEHASALQAALSTAELVTAAVQQRLSGTGGNALLASLDAAPAAAGARTLWAATLGRWGDADGDTHVAGFDQDTGGVVFGLDYRLDAGALMGLVGTYLSDRVDFHRQGETDAETWQLGVYGQYDGDRWFATGLVAAGWSDYDSERRLVFGNVNQTARASYDGHTYLIYGESGYKVPVGGLSFRPVLGLGYARGDSEDFTETGGGLYDLAVSGPSGESLASQLGLRATLGHETAGGTRVTAEARALWRHEFLDDHQQVGARFVALPGSAFRVNGVDVGHDSAVLGLGVKAQLSPGRELFVSYDAQLGTEHASHALLAGARLTW